MTHAEVAIETTRIQMKLRAIEHELICLTARAQEAGVASDEADALLENFEWLELPQI